MRARDGYSQLELTVVLAILMTMSAAVVPRITAGLDAYRALGAARYVAARMNDARMEAVKRSTNVALRFTWSDTGYDYAMFLDGNHDGVLARDIERGIDRQIRATEHLADLFAGVDFGTLPMLPAVEPGSPPPGSDPIKLGASNILTFSALGTSTPGSVYILGRSKAQFVVRALGASGRVRILRFDASARRWMPL